MSNFLLVIGTSLLIFCFISVYVWLEIFRDPKKELEVFYIENPNMKKIVVFLGEKWTIFFLIGVFFVLVGLL